MTSLIVQGNKHAKHHSLDEVTSALSGLETLGQTIADISALHADILDSRLTAQERDAIRNSLRQKSKKASRIIAEEKATIARLSSGTHKSLTLETAASLHQQMLEVLDRYRASEESNRRKHWQSARSHLRLVFPQATEEELAKLIDSETGLDSKPISQSVRDKYPDAAWADKVASWRRLDWKESGEVLSMIDKALEELSIEDPCLKPEAVAVKRPAGQVPPSSTAEEVEPKGPNWKRQLLSRLPLALCALPLTAILLETDPSWQY